MPGYSLDNQTAILAVLFLLVLSILTILACQRDRIKPTPMSTFLFSGKTFGYSVVSNIGGMFAVSTYFGAVFMYSTVFGPWSFAVAGSGFVVTYLLLVGMLGKIESSLPDDELNGGITNILLAATRRGMSPHGFWALTRLLGALYFTLVAIEIAVARVVFGALFPQHRILPALLLGIICIVVFAYLYIGGFKAILNADHLQSYVLFAFMIVLAYLATKSQELASPTPPRQSLLPGAFASAIVTNTLLLIVWLTMSVDLFSRMNITTGWERASIDRRRLLRVSFGGTLILIVLGVVFAISVGPRISNLTSGSAYAKSTVTFFMSQGSQLITLVLLLSVFCMIFTTIDTHLLTALQIGHVSGSRVLQRANLSGMVLGAVTLSVFIPDALVTPVGAFVPSLMGLPLLSVCKSLFPRKLGWVPPPERFLPLSVGIAIALFVFDYRGLSIDSSWHLNIPVYVLVAAAFSGLVLNIIRFLEKRDDTR